MAARVPASVLAKGGCFPGKLALPERPDLGFDRDGKTIEKHAHVSWS